MSDDLSRQRSLIQMLRHSAALARAQAETSVGDAEAAVGFLERAVECERLAADYEADLEALGVDVEPDV